MDNRDQGKECVMNDGKTKSAAGLYTRVDLDEVLYTDNFSVCKNCIGCGKCSRICPAEAIEMKDEHPRSGPGKPPAVADTSVARRAMCA